MKPPRQQEEQGSGGAKKRKLTLSSSAERLPAPLQSLLYSFVPVESRSTAAQLSKTVEAKHKQEWKHACRPPLSMPQYNRQQKRWICPETPDLDEFPKKHTRGYPCCLPRVIETREDMKLVLEAIRELYRGNFLTRNKEDELPRIQSMPADETDPRWESWIPKRYVSQEAALSDWLDKLLWKNRTCRANSRKFRQVSVTDPTFVSCIGGIPIRASWLQAGHSTRRIMNTCVG